MTEVQSPWFACTLGSPSGACGTVGGWFRPRPHFFFSDRESVVEFWSDGADLSPFYTNIVTPIAPTLDEYSIVVPTNEDAVLRWSGGTGAFSVTTPHESEPQPDYHVECQVDASAGSIRIPAPVLQFVREQNFLLEARVVQRHIVVVDEFLVLVSAQLALAQLLPR